MSTITSAIPLEGEIECDHDLHAFLCGLEANSFLFQPEQLRERLIALDDLDVGFGGIDSEDSTTCTGSRIHKRAKALRTRLEAANAELYQSVRFDIIRGGQPRVLLQWLQNSAGQNESQIPLSWHGLRLPGRVVERSPSDSVNRANRTFSDHRRWCPISQHPCAIFSA